MKDLRELADLYRLKQLAEGKEGGFNTSQLEEDFLKFSEFTNKRALVVKQPELYKLHDEEHPHFAAALAALDINGVGALEFIDISGAYSQNTPTDAMVILSLNQLEADHLTAARSYLNPLIEKTFSDGAAMITDFSLHEALVGRVVPKRGNLDLREAHVFPERFTSGPYQLSVVLDTPTKTVKKFKELTDLLVGFEKSPTKILNPAAVETVTTKALNLRKILGSLSRYNAVDSQEFCVETNSCVIKTPQTVFFYLYSPEKERNVLVYFGKRPFELGSEPEDLLVLPGEEYQHTLVSLMELGIFKPSTAVLNQRVHDLEQMYDSASRSAGRALGKDSPEFNALAQELTKARDFFSKVINPNMQIAYASKLSPELLEFMLCPNTDDPVVHELLPRLSWNKTMRNYHYTREFIRIFKESDEAQRQKLLRDLTAHLLFNNQQNNDVNRWLYDKYRQFCVDTGVEFEVVQ